jgi:hypothetical protein
MGISVSAGSSNGSDTAYPKYAFGRCERERANNEIDESATEN